MDATTSFKMWKRGQKLGEGTLAGGRDAEDRRVAALKKIKLECEDEGVLGTTLRSLAPQGAHTSTSSAQGRLLHAEREQALPVL